MGRPWSGRMPIGGQDGGMALSLLSESRTWTGHWWLPNSPDNKVPGVLTYEPGDGLTLRLIGGWEYRNLSTPSPGLTLVMKERGVGRSSTGLLKKGE